MPSVVEPSVLRVRDLLSESLAGVLQRPGRTVLTVLGTVLGVGAFTAILGVTATASAQISHEFTVLAATQVTVRDVGTPEDDQEFLVRDDFPADADLRVERLNGVAHAGVVWQVSKQPVQVSAGGTSKPQAIEVDGASPGYLKALDPTLKSGVLLDRFHDERRLRVAVLGEAAASELGISNLATHPAVFINGTGYTVLGILADVARSPDALFKVFIPRRTAVAEFGAPDPDRAPSMLIETKLGAAPLIASQAPKVLRPDRSQLLQSVPPPDPHQLRDAVAGNLGNLFLLLAAVTLVIGAAGIANTTFVAVLERVGEIGLRRALGARPRHIAGQFLTESALLGTLGGLIGAALGISVTLGVALAHRWTAVLDPWTTLPAPLIGTLTGLFAGSYPAVRAARIEPTQALQR
jgi:putative ABC transport system permease protein